MQQPYPELSSGIPGLWRCAEVKGQEHRVIERQDHLDKSKCSVHGSIEDPCSIDKFSKVILPHMRHIFREQNTILPGVESEDILHGSQPTSKLNSPVYIQSFQGGISVLPTPWLPHHHSSV